MVTSPVPSSIPLLSTLPGPGTVYRVLIIPVGKWVDACRQWTDSLWGDRRESRIISSMSSCEGESRVLWERPAGATLSIGKSGWDFSEELAKSCRSKSELEGRGVFLRCAPP